MTRGDLVPRPAAGAVFEHPCSVPPTARVSRDRCRSTCDRRELTTTTQRNSHMTTTLLPFRGSLVRWMSRRSVVLATPTKIPAANHSVSASGLFVVVVTLLAPVALEPGLHAQANWQNRNPPSAPPPRGEAVLVFDSVRNVSVMFGGQDRIQTFGDTWEWNGTWIQRFPTNSPPSRRSAGMAFDHRRGVTVLFGGFSTVTCSAALLGDTWEWDGSNWTQLTPSTSPPARLAPAMWFHPPTGKTLLFGGANGNSSSCYQDGMADMWEWDGATWTPISLPVVPPARFGPAVAFDGVTGLSTMFGGWRGQNSSPFGDTWSWDGSTWRQLSPIVSPTARGGHTMAYDRLRSRTVLFGGSTTDRPQANDTWEWDGVTWLQRSPSIVPPIRIWAAMTYDSVTHEIVLFGSRTSTYALGDTWTYTTNQRGVVRPLSGGCAGSAGVASLRPDPGSLPWVSDRFDLEVAPVSPGSLATFGLLGASSPNLDLTSIGMPSCVLKTSAEASFPLPRQANSAHWTIVIPNAATLVGLSIYLQSAIVEPGANGLGLVLSDGLQATVGIR